MSAIPRRLQLLRCIYFVWLEYAEPFQDEFAENEF